MQMLSCMSVSLSQLSFVLFSIVKMSVSSTKSQIDMSLLFSFFRSNAIKKRNNIDNSEDLCDISIDMLTLFVSCSQIFSIVVRLLKKISIHLTILSFISFLRRLCSRRRFAMLSKISVISSSSVVIILLLFYFAYILFNI